MKDIKLIAFGESIHLNHYPDSRLPFACLRANNLIHRFVRLNGPKTGQEFDVLDASGGFGLACLGAAHPEIRKSVIRAIEEPGYVTDEVASLERSRLLFSLLGPEGLWTNRFPSQDYQISGRNSGSEGIELALYIVKNYANTKDRRIIISFKGAWHGWTQGAASLCGHKLNNVQTPSPPSSDQFVSAVLPFGDSTLLGDFFSENKGKILAVVIEPIQGDAGIILPPNGYLRCVSKLCKQAGTILLADEVLTFSRTGQFFAMTDEKGPIPTDITVIGKSLGMGVVSTSMVISRRSLIPSSCGAVATSDLRPFTCAVINDGLKYIIKHNLLESSKEKGRNLRILLKRKLIDVFPEVFSSVRGAGLFNGIELKESAAKKTKLLRTTLIENGIYLEVMAGSGNNNDHAIAVQPTLRISPPLIISEAQIEELVARIASGAKKFQELRLNKP